MDEAEFSALRRIAGPADVETGLTALCARDRRLQAVAASAGPLPLRLEPPGFKGLARIVVGQMVSRASADAIWQRLAAHLGEVSAGACIALTPEASRMIGLSRAKEATLRSVAAAEIGEQIDLAGLCALPAEDAIRQLTALRGIGAWTAEVYLLFCAGHPDIFPAGDIALQNAVAHALGMTERPAPKALSGIALDWSPWRGVAARLFWAYYSSQMRRSVVPIG